MKFVELFKNFAKDESGAVTIDWVVLAAAIVGLGIAVFSVITNSTETIASNVDTALQGQQTLDTTLDGS
ncbi:MAG: Flp family type IVb pilin [Halocynthiibacter sp.]